MKKVILSAFVVFCMALAVTAQGIHYVGEKWGGGIVFYVFNDSSGVHGLVAATEDQSKAVIWFPLVGGKDVQIGVSGDSFGAGAGNTDVLMDIQRVEHITGNFAAKVCADYTVTVGGVTYDDWYLPSRWELYVLYQKRTVVGGFDNRFYWSSTELDAGWAWEKEFGIDEDGESGRSHPKNTKNPVRAIRSF